jgi:hypothetical protein
MADTMKVVLVQAAFTPLFAVQDEHGRILRTFGPPERTWAVHYHELAALQERVNQFEAQGTESLAHSAEPPPDPALPAK